ncbi:bax inhibitor [Trifolium pratense]|uniref:Bax inhibitor n=1 Tax=Trifolium pratense TaxID=57577 RepID=A0A2K3N866_TRIPR|nr:bax inhibitor [Trifolium pratense]
MQVSGLVRTRYGYFTILGVPMLHNQGEGKVGLGDNIFLVLNGFVKLVFHCSSLIFSSFVATALAFGCFSGAALVAKRREYLYLGGLVSSGLSILMWLHFASAIFGGSMAIFKFELYFGLLVFVGYIVVDTQEIVEKAHLGDLDYVKHALTLFTDLAAIFVRILVIMIKNSSERTEKKKKRRD